MSRKFTEDTVEQAAIDWLQQTGYTYIHGGTIAPDEPTAERETYNDVILVGRLHSALERINGHIPRSVRADVVDEVIRRYQNRTIDISAVITELIHIAKDMRDATKRGAALGLTEDEVAFYDALADNKSAVEVMGDKQLAVIALELVKSVRSNVTIDWTVKETARAKIRVMVKRILRHFGYPPDLQDAATDLVLEQAAALAARPTKQRLNTRALSCVR